MTGTSGSRTVLAAGRAGKLAYIDARQGWSYGALADRVDRFGNMLRSLGLRREERIIICLLDGIDWPTAFLGAIKAGVVPIPVNTLMTEYDYRFMLADSRAKVLVVSEALFAKFANLIGAMPDLMHVIVSGDNARGYRRFEDLLTTLTISREAARRLGDRRGEGGALNNLGFALVEVRRFDEAVTACQDAAAIYRETGDRHGEGIAIQNLEKTRAAQAAEADG